MEPFANFVESYRNNPSGVNHELLVAFKGFDSDIDLHPYEQVLAGLQHTSIQLPDVGYDIHSYALAKKEASANILCFLNSYTRLLVPDWLLMMCRHLDAHSVGVVGTTASYGSHLSFLMGSFNLPSYYKGVMPEEFLRERPHAIRIGKAIENWFSGRASLAPQLWDYGKSLARLVWYVRRFDTFPAYHVRTNGFAVWREYFPSAMTIRTSRKLYSYQFESGHRSITQQLRRLGLGTLVAGRNECSYEPEDWHLSDTFWQGRQENLLVADNQTNDYHRGDAERRLFLSRCAWGEFARPDLSSW